MSHLNVPRITTVDVEVKHNEPIYRTPLSDMHVDSSLFDKERFRSWVKERNALPNHKFWLFGDTLDMIVPKDLRRYTPGTVGMPQEKEEWFDERVEYGAEMIQDEFGMEVEIVTMGNHEYQFLRHHGANPVRHLSRLLGCPRGGYFGVHRIRVHGLNADGTRTENRVLFRAAYHHGAWGGKVLKGFGGARDFIRRIGVPWNVFCYGHNHELQTHAEPMIYESGEKLLRRKVYYVLCGTWQQSFFMDDADMVTYPELRGYPPTLTDSPLIEIRFKNHGGNGRHPETGMNGWQLHYSVTV